MNDYVNLTLENIEKEHLCCAIGDPKHQKGVDSKKQWMRERIKEGHVFRKLNAQGKVFVEFAPLEKAWAPIGGDDYLYIYCLWVAGSFKEKGYGKELIEYVIKEAKEKKRGVCTISSKKKKPFLADKKFFLHYGFKVVDTIGDYELLALSFANKEPQFMDNARKMEVSSKDFTIYYSNQCPYVENSIKEIKDFSLAENLPLNVIKVDTLEKAKEVPCIFNNWANFLDGKFISNTLLNKNSFEKFFKR